MNKLITAMILLGMITTTAATPATYSTRMHIVQKDSSGWCQLEDETSVAMLHESRLSGSTEAGTDYIIVWDTNGTAEKSDDTTISAKEA